MRYYVHCLRISFFDGKGWNDGGGLTAVTKESVGEVGFAGLSE